MGAVMTRQLDPDQLPGTPGGDGLICAECVHGGIADDWCDCVADGADIQQCRGPCRQRAHEPERCPFRDAYVPLPIRWSQVEPGDVIRWRNGELHMVTWTGGCQCHAPNFRPGAYEIQTVRGIYAGQLFHSTDPDRPVPVLVPYAERAALLTLRAGGLNPTMIRDRP